MNLHCTKSSRFTKNNNIKIECEIDLKMDLYSRCYDCS